MLPPTFRDLWKGRFQELKNEDATEGRAWMYEADPFATMKERDEASASKNKQREAAKTQKTKAAEGLVLNGSIKGVRSVQTTSDWAKVPEIDMGRKTRMTVEDLIRRKVVWNPHNATMTDYQKLNIVQNLTNLNFRQSHVEEAVEECKDQAETLEWLLVHVPEDDLPRWTLPEGYAPGVSMASGNLRRQGSILRLSGGGYPAELCAQVLDECQGDESQAAEALQDKLADSSRLVSATGRDDRSALTPSKEEIAIWEQEQATLEAIYSDRFETNACFVWNITLHVPQSSKPFFLHVRKSSTYPRSPPVVSVTSPGLPAYIRLSIIRQIVQYACSNSLGQPMVFDLVDWLEAMVPRILENPGKLREIAAGASSDVQLHKRSSATRRRAHKTSPGALAWRTGSKESIELLDRWKVRQSDPRQQKMIIGRQSLPAWALQEAIVETVNECQVTIISGETGSGKSTQSVQFILDDMIERQSGAKANIICTQPRRISALGLADRVSDERLSRLGDEVGYIIRGDSRIKTGVTRITFVTTGVLLRRLQKSGGSTEAVVDALADVSHVVIDEVHERSLDTDFLLVLLGYVLKKRPSFKLILMSATLDAAIFENYFGRYATVGKVEIPGRTFHVEDYYLDDVIRLTGFRNGSRTAETEGEYSEGAGSSLPNTVRVLGFNINYDLIASTVRTIDLELGNKRGSILIFLPGTLEINRTMEAVRKVPNIVALPLHASLTPAEQRCIFPPVPKGQRKVVAATNVAETSITIEDIVAVIDLGRVKETSFDPQNSIAKLEEVWASRAACKQRRGRAGRVQVGKCYKLYTRNAEANMVERPAPEILRVPLEQLCLSVRAMGIMDVPEFLASALTPPENAAVEGALGLLRHMGALDGDQLTALGRHLSLIPADLRCGKLMVYGATFGCFEACLTVASILTAKGPFVSPQAKRDESKAARSSFATGSGDLICDLRAYEAWSNLSKDSGYKIARSWCDEHFLSSQTLSDISSNRSQYLSSLIDTGFLPSFYDSTGKSPLNAHNADDALIRAVVAGSFSPQLARIDFPDTKYAASASGALALDPEARSIKFFNQANGRVFVHPSSTLFDAQHFVGGSRYMSYFNIMATSKVFIKELTRKCLVPIHRQTFIPNANSGLSIQLIQCFALLRPNFDRHSRPGPYC